jgi:hypothetical protein
LGGWQVNDVLHPTVPAKPAASNASVFGTDASLQAKETPEARTARFAALVTAHRAKEAAFLQSVGLLDGKELVKGDDDD